MAYIMNGANIVGEPVRIEDVMGESVFQEVAFDRDLDLPKENH